MSGKKRPNRAIRDGEILHRGNDGDIRIKAKIEIEVEGQPDDLEKIFDSPQNLSGCPCGASPMMDHKSGCIFVSDNKNEISHGAITVDYDVVDEPDDQIGRWGDYQAELTEPTPERINVLLRKSDGTVVAKLQAWEEMDEYGEEVIRVSADGKISDQDLMEVYAPIMRDYYEHKTSDYFKNPEVKDVKQPKPRIRNEPDRPKLLSSNPLKSSSDPDKEKKKFRPFKIFKRNKDEDDEN